MHIIVSDTTKSNYTHISILPEYIHTRNITTDITERKYTVEGWPLLCAHYQSYNQGNVYRTYSNKTQANKIIWESLS